MFQKTKIDQFLQKLGIIIMHFKKYIYFLKCNSLHTNLLLFHCTEIDFKNEMKLHLLKFCTLCLDQTRQFI